MNPIARTIPGHCVLAFLRSRSAEATQPTKGRAAQLRRGAARFVNQKDEIVAVLKNGMAMMVKRMPSPVVAVRGYIGAGGVYEGKWLGGGLWHLLEHLVARQLEATNRSRNRKLLQKIGNNSNAYTYADHTAFFINTTPEHIEYPQPALLTGWLFGASSRRRNTHEYQVVQRTARPAPTGRARGSAARARAATRDVGVSATTRRWPAIARSISLVSFSATCGVTAPTASRRARSRRGLEPLGLVLEQVGELAVLRPCSTSSCGDRVDRRLVTGAVLEVRAQRVEPAAALLDDADELARARGGARASCRCRSRGRAGSGGA